MARYNSALPLPLPSTYIGRAVEAGAAFHRLVMSRVIGCAFSGLSEIVMTRLASKGLDIRSRPFKFSAQIRLPGRGLP